MLHEFFEQKLVENPVVENLPFGTGYSPELGLIRFQRNGQVHLSPQAIAAK
jgi:hypothetical protein